MLYSMSRLPCHPSLQSYTWRKGGVLAELFMSELNETFSVGLKYVSEQVGRIISSLRNQPVLQESRMTLGRQLES